MKTLYLLCFLILGIGLSACQPKQHSTAEQQKFVCRTLIDSFLKIQSMSQYRLDHIDPIRSDLFEGLLYTYKALQSHHLNIMPQKLKLQFECQKIAARKFQIKLHYPKNMQLDSSILFMIELPKQQPTPLITYAVAPPKFSLLK